ncbi:MAG TPA: molybdopterin molybdotransferase MoeA [Rubrivivax sp.]|nr:molybdopterin molybdotransferase MoeA [Burkholderiales bacterium]HNU10519.1 molybdopterin molybdotransferase MoeA [Rubrivivax sp.]
MSELGESPLFAGHRHLSVDEARAAIRLSLQPVDGSQTLPLLQALGRVLDADVLSPIDVPPHDNSAMDGYAFGGSAMRPDAPTVLEVIGTLHAGQPFTAAVAAGQCLRIMTGAVMPSGCDTVVPQELCRVDGDRVTIPPGTVEPGENRRPRGEDLARGRPALRAGQRLRPADLGLLASLGFEQVSVRRRVRVALFSTGNEIQAPGKPLAPGCVYDSNRYSLAASLQRLGCEVIDLGLVADDPKALRATFERAIAEADAVLTSGGVSVGEADYTRQLMAELGDVAFWRVAMRPGRPFAFGPLHAHGRRAWLFALPGNPVAALVTFHAFVREALLQLAGASAQPFPALRLPCATPIRKRPGRTEFQRAIVEPGPDGRWAARLTGSQGAGILRSLSEANALVVLGHDQGSVNPGDEVTVWLFDGLV